MSTLKFEFSLHPLLFQRIRISWKCL